MTDPPAAAVPPEAYEAAARAELDHLGLVIRGEPLQRAGARHISRRKSEPEFRAAVAAVWWLAVAATRKQAAKEIRNRATEIAARSEVAAGVPTGAADDHPLMLGLEFAARVVEGDHGG